MYCRRAFSLIFVVNVFSLSLISEHPISDIGLTKKRSTRRFSGNIGLSILSISKQFYGEAQGASYRITWYDAKNGDRSS
jgi:hypothetical protein